MTNLDSIFKSKDITLPRKTHFVKAMVFPVVMYRCGSWTTKKAEHWRIYAFKLWCWRRLLSPLDSKEIRPVNSKGNQSWIFIGRTDAEAETLIIWPPDAKNCLIWKDPDAGKDWGQRRRGWQSMRWLDGIADSIDMSLSKCGRQWRTGNPGVLQFIGHKESITLLSNWTTISWDFCFILWDIWQRLSITSLHNSMHLVLEILV